MQETAKTLPSGLNATQPLTPGWAAEVAVFLPAATSHSRAVPSERPAEARVLPSGLNARPQMSSSWPVRVARSLGFLAAGAGAATHQATAAGSSPATMAVMAPV